MKVLIAPDSFKGSLTSVEVARALAEGWRQVRPDDEIDLVPLADGGEGTLAAIEASGGWERRIARARDPLDRWIDAPWLHRTGDGGAAVVELAAASGLSRVGPGELDPLGATTHGTGDLLRAAMDAGVHRVVLGIGGSATTDGGRGILEALGAAVEAEGSDGRLRVGLERLDLRLARLELDVACDVQNPLLGPHGAAATYGPQKGASAAQIEILDGRNAAWADALEAATGRSERETAGAGAAGGVGFAMLCLADRFQRFALRPGIELLMDTVWFAARAEEVDLIVTGEGRIDWQTAFGKTALGVARAAKVAHVRCIAIGGGVEEAGAKVLESEGAQVIPVWERPVPLAEAMAAGAAPLIACGARMAAMEPTSPR